MLKTFSSLVSNPENKQDMKGSARGHRYGKFNVNVMDRHKTEEARKFRACFVASQSLLCNKSVSH